MKILEVNKFYYLRGGSERYMFELSDLLRDKGHEVIHLSMKDKNNLPSDNSQYFIDNLDYERFNWKAFFRYFYNPQAVRNIKKIIKDEKPDLVHIHNIAHQLTPAIIKTIKSFGIPVIQTLHDYKIICPNSKLFTNNQNCQKCQGGKYYNCFLNSCMHNSRAKSLMGMFEAYYYGKINKVYDLVDVFLAPSEFIKNKHIELGIAEERIEVLNNFIDTDKFVNESTENEDYYLYFGRLSYEKGVLIAIEAILKTKNQKLKIMGDGPDMENFKRYVQKASTSRIEFLGNKKGDELATIVKKAKAVIVPSLWYENMPYSILEALSYSKTVIASRIGGMPEMIEDGKSGLLFETGNIKKLSEILDNLDNNKCINIGRNAKIQAKTFSPENHYKTLQKVFKRLNIGKKTL